MYSTRIFIAALVSALLFTNGQSMYQGDIVLTPEQQSTLEATSNPSDPFSPQQAVVRNARSLWPSAAVPYILDASLGNDARTAIQAAIDEYKARTCVNFIPRTTQSDYVRFFRGNGCFSYIGRVSGPQDISIGQGCEFKGIVMHEMFHALGRWHEQSRPDRDQFVTILTQNIRSGFENNFETTNTAFVTTQSVPYDTRSIMHYGAYAFSRNTQPTIVPVDSSISLNDLGQRNGFTASDIQHVNTLYCGGSGSTGSWSAWSSWSSCSRTCNGGTRTRTRSCVGGTGCEGSNIDTEQCNTAACPVPSSWGQWTSWGTCSATCGGGRQQRIRSCVGGNTCVGRNAEFRDCNTNSCPQPPTWGAWGSWSACSSTCQGGVRERRRLCQNGNTCSGVGIQTEFCNSNILCTSGPNPGSGEWSQWSQCTKSCGGGTRFRVRMCGNSNCNSEQEACNTQDCNPEPNLRGHQHVGCYFVPRFSSRLRLLEGTTEELSDDPLSRLRPIAKCGSGAQQSGFNFFAVSVGYCISGSNRLSDYQYIRNSFCNGGTGGYISGYFVMDVYQIVNQQLFLDSISQVAPTTEVPTTTNSDLIVDSGAPVINTSLTVLLSVAFFTVFYILLQ